MPTFAEAASAFRNRFGFQEPSDSESVRSSPALFKSASKDRLFQSSATTIPMLSTGEMDDFESFRGGSSQTFDFQEDPSFWKDQSVQVIIRIRPLNSSEISLQGHSKCVRQDSCQAITWTGHPESRFTFDLVADESVSQEKLFKVAGLPMVENCMGGYNSCMFAYGQTGSGKTHTMLGDIEGGTRRHSVNCGMTPRVFECLFSRIQKEKDSRKEEKLRYTCKCSFLEIYNEQILDLLDPSNVNLQIREDAKRGVYVENLREYEVSSARDVIQQLVQGAANRKVASTNMNHASSRSHSVFTCVIESKWESQGVTHHRFARLNLVDLAGSERQKSSGAEGERLKEATNINKSLSTLGLVIMNLVSISNGKAQHVPYRDSKLTFLLQDSLGGNSKTTIIANISPSNCCALETLSTLKFAQRAKFIKNNAIVNEDASGDVLTMRIQIQQLKKEVSRLRDLVNGGAENQDCDNWSVCFPGSPGSFKWDVAQASLSPLTSVKRTSQKKEYEVALVGAFRREKDKEIALKALAAENEAAIQLAKQREEEIQSLKMRLRFREAGIKRLEAVASGKISAEVHLLQEKDELLKEIDVLRSQVDRNQEVTRFAMENLQLKEELRRLQSFYEGGEREMMNEQIKILQSKLLEALDWKLMHEKDPGKLQNGSLDFGVLGGSEENLLTSSQEPSSLHSSTNVENEFLHIQAIQNQREVEALRKNLTFCLEAKEKLERRVDELVSRLEEARASTTSTRKPNEQLLVECSQVNCPDHDATNNQMELKTMVDAIAAASEREAEAHETAIVLSKENEELQLKLKVLIDDNSKLIELYETVVAEGNSKATLASHAVNAEDHAEFTEDGHEHANQESYQLKMKEVEHLEHQLHEIQEENEKLMGMYEKAMQERDEFKRMVSSIQKKDVEVKEFTSPKKPGVSGELSDEGLKLASVKLELAEDKLANAAKFISFFGLLENSIIELEKFSKEIEDAKNCIQAKQQEIAGLKLQSSEMQERKVVTHKKLLALKSSLSSFSSSLGYWEQREARSRAKVDASSYFVEKKKEELTFLQACKDENETAQMKAQQSEVALRNSIDYLKSKLQDAECQRQSEKVLFAIDNVDQTNLAAQRSWQFNKAGDLLKSEEERIKLGTEIKQARDKVASVKREIEELKHGSTVLATKIENVTAEIVSGSTSMKEAEIKLQNVLQEKETLMKMLDEGKDEVEKLIFEFHSCFLEFDLKEEEIKLQEGELLLTMRSLGELRASAVMGTQKRNQLLEHNFALSHLDEQSWHVSQKAEEELRDIQRSLLEAKSLLTSSNRYERVCSAEANSLLVPVMAAY